MALSLVFRGEMALQVLKERINAAVLKHVNGYPQRIEAARKGEKVFRDPIFGFQRFYFHETLIIDSPLFQRLRGIFQTALAYLTYPSSIHTRFEHSLNCVHLATRILEALESRKHTVDESRRLEVRLAALLHDIGHCVFSHGSEFFYREFSELCQALKDPEVAAGRPSPGELVNYCIITSDAFRDHVWRPVVKKCGPDLEALFSVKLEHVAQMVIGSAPADDANSMFLTDIVNGPFDVDKLDYLTRDSYFTGIGLSVDIDRLLPSVCVAFIKNPNRDDRVERKLVVDHKGIAVVEQMLFARMLLYDTVYHHHKVRAATQDLLQLLHSNASRAVWPTSTGKLDSISDLLEIDEYDFFGHPYGDVDVRSSVSRLRHRDLMIRALVIAPRCIVDGESFERLTSNWELYGSKDQRSRQIGRQFFDKEVLTRIISYARKAGAIDLKEADIAIDIPDPPGLEKLGLETYILLANRNGEDQVVPLTELFPFNKVTSNYSKQYKYRTYVFARERHRKEVAYGAFRALADLGIRLNDLSLILAHQADRGHAYDLLLTNGVSIPDWRTSSYVPDRDALRREAAVSPCANCAHPMEADWKFCPQCATAASGQV